MKAKKLNYLLLAIIFFLIADIVFLLYGCASTSDNDLRAAFYHGRVMKPVDEMRPGDCRRLAEREAKELREKGYIAEVVHARSRSPHEWNHAICRVMINGDWWVVPDGVIINVPWRYDEVRKQCYDFILP